LEELNRHLAMIKPNINKAKSLRIARIGVFSALYVVTSLIPISMFIGAPSFLSLNLIVTPTIAAILPPTEALFAAIFGGTIALYLIPGQAMFGPFTILLPVAGATFGSLAFHKQKTGALAASIFLATAISAYLIKNYAFPYFIIPHILAIILASISPLFNKRNFRILAAQCAFISTMCEQGMMMIFAVHLLCLPWQAFVGILPLMIYERLIGTIGGAMLIITLQKFFPNILKK